MQYFSVFLMLHMVMVCSYSIDDMNLKLTIDEVFGSGILEANRMVIEQDKTYC